MTSKQIDLVQESFKKVERIARDAAGLFYTRLFEIDPALRSMFRGDIEEQGRKLMQVLAFAVASLRHPDRMMTTLYDLGRRHTAYGVTDEHYATVAAALLWTLEQGLGDAFTDEVRDAWAAAYELLSSAMKSGFRAAVAAA